MLNRFRALVVAAAIAIVIPSSPRAEIPFFTETIDPGGFVGTNIHIAVDHTGTPHVVYWDLTNQFLRYATRVDGAWMTEVAAAQGFVGTDCDIAVDAQGVPHISFHNFTIGSDELFYVNRSGGAWGLVETVDPTNNNVGRYNAIALDSQGRPHISYYDATLGDLKYAVKSGAWSISTPLGTGTVGQYTDIALDASDQAHISYYSATAANVFHAQLVGGTWYFQSIGTAAADYTGMALDPAGNPVIGSRSGGYLSVARRTSSGTWSVETLNSGSDYAGALAVDSEDQAHIFYDYVLATDDDLWYAVRRDTGWVEEPAYQRGPSIIVGTYSDIALDPYGNPVGAFSNDTAGDALYIDAGVRLSTPLSGVTWPVGSERTIVWRGAGTVDLLLSTDGGATYEALATGLRGIDNGGGQHTFTVPHRPSRFCKIKLERPGTPYHYAAALSESLFTIETDIALLNFVITLDDVVGGNHLAWSTNPGPEDLAGYRIDRQRNDDWSTLVALTRETEFNDATGRGGDEYRLFAVNGLGQPLLVGTGRAGQTPSYAPLDAFPNPFGTGELTVLFATGGLGGTSGRAVVSVYDVAGRLVRRLVDDSFAPGIQNATWDGRDANGALVASGVYFIRSHVGAEVHTRKISVVR